jgi:hypothetical protein
MEITKKIGGKEYGFKFTPFTTQVAAEYLKVDLADVQEYINKNSINGVNALFRAAIDVYSKGDKSLNKYEMDDLLEQMTDDDFLDIYTCAIEGQQGWITKIQTVTLNSKKVKKK